MYYFNIKNRNQTVRVDCGIYDLIVILANREKRSIAINTDPACFFFIHSKLTEYLKINKLIDFNFSIEIIAVLIEKLLTYHDGF